MLLSVPSVRRKQLAFLWRFFPFHPSPPLEATLFEAALLGLMCFLPGNGQQNIRSMIRYDHKADFPEGVSTFQVSCMNLT